MGLSSYDNIQDKINMEEDESNANNNFFQEMRKYQNKGKVRCSILFNHSLQILNICYAGHISQKHHLNFGLAAV